MDAPLPKKCGHGVPFGDEHRCIDCEIVWETEGLAFAQADVERHRKKIAKLEAEKITCA